MTEPGPPDHDEPITIETDERTGFPEIRVGRKITIEDVEAILDEE